VFLVAAGDGRSGRLVVDRRASRAGWARVAYATGDEEVDATQLRIVRIE
jgi:ParB family chromosome partitioning protein